MLTTARTITSLVAGAALAVLGNGLMGTAVALRSTSDFSSVEAALVLAAYYVGLALGPLTVASLIARIGHIRVFASAAAASAASFLLLPLWSHPAHWIAQRAISGYAMAAMFIVLESWLHAKASSDDRGKLLSVYIAAAQLALAGGQLLLFAFPPDDDRVFTLGALLHVVALIPIALTFIEQPPAPSGERFGVRKLFAAAPLGILGCLASGIVVGTLLTLGPVFVVALGYDVEHAAVFMLVLTAAGLAPQWTVGHLSDRVGRRPVLIGVGGLLALAATALASGQALPYPWLLALAAATGALAFLIYPLATAYANDLVQPGQIVAVSGTLIVTFAVGALLGPLLGTATARLVGTGGPFYLVAGAAVALTVASAYRMLVRRAIPRDEWSEYAPRAMPQAVPTGSLRADSETDG